MQKLIAVAVLALGLTGGAASQDMAARMPGTFMYDCVNGKEGVVPVPGKPIEECRKLEWASFDRMVETFKQGGACARWSDCRYSSGHGLY